RANAAPEPPPGNEAVPRRAVPLLRARIGARPERRERAPARRSELDRNTRLRIVEMLHDVAIHALEAIDVAPRRLPFSEIRGELVRRRRKCLQERVTGRAVLDVRVRAHPSAARI